MFPRQRLDSKEIPRSQRRKLLRSPHLMKSRSFLLTAIPNLPYNLGKRRNRLARKKSLRRRPRIAN